MASPSTQHHCQHPPLAKINKIHLFGEMYILGITLVHLEWNGFLDNFVEGCQIWEPIFWKGRKYWSKKLRIRPNRIIQFWWPLIRLQPQNWFTGATFWDPIMIRRYLLLPCHSCPLGKGMLYIIFNVTRNLQANFLLYSTKNVFLAWVSSADCIFCCCFYISASNVTN